MAAIRNSPAALRFASPGLQADKEVVLMAVAGEKGDIRALQYAAPGLQGDKEVAIAVVNNDPDNIKYIPDNELKHDRDVLIAAGMYDENHDTKRRLHQQQGQRNSNSIIRKVALSTRFSLIPTSKSQAAS